VRQTDELTAQLRTAIESRYPARVGVVAEGTKV